MVLNFMRVQSFHYPLVSALEMLLLLMWIIVHKGILIIKKKIS